MAEDQKVLQTEQINWYEEEENRLDYEVVFGGENYQKSKANKESAEPKVDVKKLIQKRDEKWKKRLENAREKMFEKGRQKGFEEGYKEAEQQVDQKLSKLEGLIQEAHEDWCQRQELINPGLLDLTFDIVEKIVGLPIENPQIRQQLEEELSVLLHQSDDEIKPLLWISKEDYKFVEGIVKKYAPELSISIRISEKYNPGEFELETEKETVVHRFREKVTDFKENLSLPSWK